LILTYIHINIDAELCLERGVDTNLTSSIDKLMLSQPQITKVNEDKRTFIIGPNGGGTGTTFFDIFLTFNISDIAVEDISKFQGITKEEYMNKFVKLDEELANTKPELSVCRFWAKKH
jgi:hypothetical protein